ncbi:hypothetical protein Cgig2_030404 [Carnegiea gigantea]|uniref:Zinc-ribbon domain-containing protein n=1 Tax=Carnegiea gigantea TaxID=171969 RepID=A0A9Q1KKQ2_9CARY|nr:hypothetical protein Cgig2_030404 [Carnegiea gigantea]
MAETLKLCLVRCPQCESLLQEHPDYSIYQCGGCGAILRARRGKLDGNKESERFDEKRVGVVSDTSDNFLGKLTVSDAENVESKVIDGDGSCEIVAQNIGNDSKTKVGTCVVEEENSSRNQVGNGKVDSKVDKLERQIENSNGLSRSGRFLESKLSDRGMNERFWRMRRDHFERGRFSSSNKFNEDRSRFSLDSSYSNQASRSIRIDYIDHDREELLRKLDELKDQLIRYQTVKGKAPEKTLQEATTAEYHVEHDGYFHDHPSSWPQASSQFSASNKHIARPPYFDSYHEPLPIINDSDVATFNYPNPVHSSNHAPRFEDPFEPHMFPRPQPRRIPSHHRYMSLEPDPFEPHHYSVTLNQPSCACYQCYAREQQVPRQMPPSAFSNRRFSHVANKSIGCHHEVQIALGSHGYDTKEVNNPLKGSCDPQSHTRHTSDINVEVGAFPRARPTRVLLTKEHSCHPVAGGAPFVTCHNCFKLLKLPKKVSYNKGEWKLSCGACFSVISFGIVDEKLVSLDTSASYSTTDDLDSCNDVGNGRGNHLKRHNASFCSEDYANSVYDLQAMDGGRASSSSCQDMSTSKSEEMHNICSVSATTTRDEHFSDELVARQVVTSTAKPCDIPFPPASPPQDSFDYTSKYRTVNRGGKGSLSSRLDQERIMTNKSNLRHPSLKESLATEMEIPDDYADPEVLQDSADTYREDDQQKGKKGADSFLAGIIKKSFKSTQTTGSGKRNITVNGHLIPDRLVKKAEKLAGPIYPGKYWYDYQAGFWGVMGGPCLGIIPPHIQEFSYPMLDKCGGGNTGVFVNGRELHQKDLDLLASRGLPAARDKSYTVELSGRVVDKDSGKEIVNLGKLAPTVEKLRCGFGMRPPEGAA